MAWSSSSSKRTWRQHAARRMPVVCSSQNEASGHGNRGGKGATSGCGRRAMNMLPILSLSSSISQSAKASMVGDAADVIGSDIGGTHTHTYRPHGSPQTVVAEIVKNRMWSCQQAFEVGETLATPLRSVVIRLKDEFMNPCLWILNPLQPTKELQKVIEDLLCEANGSTQTCKMAPNRISLHIVCSTYAVEHLRNVQDWIRLYADRAEGYVVEDCWTLKERKDVKSLKRLKTQYIDEKERPLWMSEIDMKILELGRVAPFGGNITEAVFYDKLSQTILVTDLATYISTNIPDERIIRPQLLANIARDTTADTLPIDSNESRLKGWRRLVLLTLFFTPEHEELAIRRPIIKFDPRYFSVTIDQWEDISLTEKLDGAQLPHVSPYHNRTIFYQYWTSGEILNFTSIAERVLCPPVLQLLFYCGDSSKRRKAILQQLIHSIDSDWEIKKFVPAHFDIFENCTNKDFVKGFEFLTSKRGTDLMEKDLRTLRSLTNLQNTFQNNF